MMTSEWHLPTRHLGRRVLLFERIDSTNNYAAQLGADPANHGTVVVAYEQSAGRGQYGRSWQAPPASSVLMSVLLFPPQQLQRPAVLTAWAAVSVCELSARLCGVGAQIKWPNDILIGGRKVCGILIEQRAGNGHIATVAGIGLNVRQTADWFRTAGLHEATSLETVSGRAHELQDVVRELIVQLDDELDRLLTEGRASLEERWKTRVGLVGQEVVVVGTPDSYRGMLRDLSFDAVELELASGELARLPPEEVRHIKRRDVGTFP
jgi:BirA family biotin operon repressor/biotin-[acetyl-CoA-carboxylase] ligase